MTEEKQILTINDILNKLTLKMEKNTKKIVDSYIKKVIKELKVNKHLLYVFKEQFKEDVYAFAEEKSSVSYEDLEERFGEPKTIACEFFSREDYIELIKKSKKRRNIWIVVTIISVIIAVLLTILLIAIIISQNSGGHIVVYGPVVTRP